MEAESVHAGGGWTVGDYLPYGRQWIDESDIAAVVEVLRSDYLTTGPRVQHFEERFAREVGSKEAVALSSGTAALHAALHGLDVRAGDEVLVPAVTFVATANAVLYQGGKPIIVDVDPDTLLIDLRDAEYKRTDRTVGVIAVDYAGQPCDYDEIRSFANRHGMFVLADACHSLGASYNGQAVGTLVDASAFSLHPVKAITAGEGGVVTTNNHKIAEKVRRFRNHGIDMDHWRRSDTQTWEYSVTTLGYNYRLSDIHCALADSQLSKLRQWIRRRNEIAADYDSRIQDLSELKPLSRLPHRTHAFHLYVVRLMKGGAKARKNLFQSLRSAGIGVAVHYRPVHLHPYYRQLGYQPGQCPIAEAAYDQLLTLPTYPSMNVAALDEVIRSLKVGLGIHAA